MNDLDPIEAGQVSSETPDVSTSTPDPTPAVQTPSPTQVEQMFEVKIGGQARKVALQELQAGYQRQQDYTQKTMALAEERRRLEAQWQSERQQTREFLSRRENVQQLLQYLESQQGPQVDPSQPITQQQLQQMLAQRDQQFAQSRDAERQQLMQELELKQMQESYSADIGQHIQGILASTPVLKSIYQIETILKRAAAEGQPATLQEAKQLIQQKAAEQADAIRAHFTEQQKQVAVQQGKLRGIEPPGGAAPMPAPKSVGKMGSPEFNSDVTEYLRKLSGG
jgi:hypothetical protein